MASSTTIYYVLHVQVSCEVLLVKVSLAQLFSCGIHSGICSLLQVSWGGLALLILTKLYCQSLVLARTPELTLPLRVSNHPAG